MAEADGTERHRAVGYLPTDDLLAQLELGLAKAAFRRGQFREARSPFRAVADRYPKTEAPPEAVYWVAVSAYKGRGKPDRLRERGLELRNKRPGSDWAKKGSVRLGCSWSESSIIKVAKKCISRGSMT